MLCRYHYHASPILQLHLWKRNPSLVEDCNSSQTLEPKKQIIINLWMSFQASKKVYLGRECELKLTTVCLPLQDCPRNSELQMRQLPGQVLRMYIYQRPHH